MSTAGRPPRKGEAYRVTAGHLDVLGEWLPQLTEVFLAYGCTSLRWHRSKKPREGLAVVGRLEGLEALDVITHMSLRDWEPPRQLARLFVALRGRAHGTQVRLGTMTRLEHLILEGAQVTEPFSLPNLQVLEIDRHAGPVDLQEWVTPGLRLLTLSRSDVVHWEALESAHQLERLYVNGKQVEPPGNRR